MKRETRQVGIEVDSIEGRTIEATVLVYGVVDDYGTRWVPGVFARSLEGRMPKIVWSHDWSDPLGRWVDYRDDDERLVLIGEMDDPDDVPRVRQALSQLGSGTIDQFSVGFVRKADRVADDGVTEITEADLDEVSLVIAGAVPGTELLSVRTVPSDDVVELARRIAEGQLSADDAHAELDRLADGGELEAAAGDGSELVLAEAHDALEDLDL